MARDVVDVLREQIDRGDAEYSSKMFSFAFVGDPRQPITKVQLDLDDARTILELLDLSEDHVAGDSCSRFSEAWRAAKEARRG